MNKRELLPAPFSVHTMWPQLLCPSSDRGAGGDSAAARAQALAYFPSQGFFSGGHSTPLGDLFLLSGSSTTLVTLLLLFVMGMGGSVWMIMLAAG